MTPENGDDQKFDRHVFGTLPQNLPAYELLAAQMDAASGDYEAADKVLGEADEEVKRQAAAAVFPMMVQLDLVSPGRVEFANAPEGTLAALLVADILLKNAPRATGMPWQIINQLPIRLQLPVEWKRQPGNWVSELIQGNEFFVTTRQMQTDVWALRAWLRWSKAERIASMSMPRR